jgi:membrane protein DedA with SNARE-associated domain
MEIHLDQIVEWIKMLSPLGIYGIFSLVAYVENIIPPLPGDVLVAFGGYLAAEQIIGFGPALAVTTIFSVFGFITVYGIGAYFGDKIEEYRNKFWLAKLVDIKYYDKAKMWMAQWGQMVILMNRFLAGTRSVISIVAGVTRTKFSTTVLSSFLSSLIWNSLLLSFGWIVHENWQTIGHYLNIYGWFILGVIVIAVTLRYFYGKRKKGSGKNK